MAFVKGQSGNPGGRGTDKPWREALRRALARKADKGKGVEHSLELVADKVVELALAGDVSCIKEIGDRLDGKAHQSVTATVRDVRQLSDSELAAILQEDGSEGAADAPVDPRQLN